MTTEPNLTEWRERAEFWASRDPDSGLYDKDAVAFASEVVALLNRLREVLHERNEWQGQVVGIRNQHRATLREVVEVKSEWTDWLASIGYGVDYSGPADPPCTLDQLADAYVRVTGEEDRTTWALTIADHAGASGAFRSGS